MGKLPPALDAPGEEPRVRALPVLQPLHGRLIGLHDPLARHRAEGCPQARAQILKSRKASGILRLPGQGIGGLFDLRAGTSSSSAKARLSTSMM